MDMNKTKDFVTKSCSSDLIFWCKEYFYYDYRTSSNKGRSWIVAVPKKSSRIGTFYQFLEHCYLIKSRQILMKRIIVWAWKNNFWIEAASLIGAVTVNWFLAWKTDVQNLNWPILITFNQVVLHNVTSNLIKLLSGSWLLKKDLRFVYKGSDKQLCVTTFVICFEDLGFTTQSYIFHFHVS